MYTFMVFWFEREKARKGYNKGQTTHKQHKCTKEKYTVKPEKGDFLLLSQSIFNPCSYVAQLKKYDSGFIQIKL